MAKTKKTNAKSAARPQKPGAKKSIARTSSPKKAAPAKAAAKRKPAPLKKKPIKKQVKAPLKPAKPNTRSLVRKDAPKAPDGIPEKLRDAALQVLDERQAEDVNTIDVKGKSAIPDSIIIASGSSARQVSAMAGYLREIFFKHGMKNIRVEGLPEGNWVLVDTGDVVVHLFRPEVRRYYNLENIWDGSAGDDEYQRLSRRDADRI